MAASYTTSSPSFPMTSHLSTINVSNFVSSKLGRDKTSNNYSSWKKQILCLINSQDLAGFVNGEIQPHKAEGFAIRRIDSLVMGWILGALDEAVLDNVANLTTARDVWLELEKIFGEPAGQSQMGQAGGNEWHAYLPLYRATVEGDWTRTVEILHQDSNAIKASLNSNLQTSLHIAIGTSKAIDFVDDLLKYMPNDLLGQQDKFGYTALHVAAQAGNMDAARILVGRRRDLLHQTNNAGEFPVHVAAISSRIDTLKYLISKTKDDDVLPSPYRGETGVKLLCNLIDSKALDIALDLAKAYPELSAMKLEDGSSALKRIALYKTEEKELSTLERWAKRSAPLRTWTNKKAIEVVKCFCKNMESLDYCKASAIYEDAILMAARSGKHEMIKEIVATFPAAIYTRDIYTKQSIFHVAAENRHGRAFDLIDNNGNLKNQISNMRDSSGNTFLHSAARLSTRRKLNLLDGAALQMHYEISWFKKIENLLQPNLREAANNAGKTPWTVFTEEHASLKAEAEKWVKDTANACIIVATLIATVSFAAVITVPGGNESSTGVPLLSKKNAFKLFSGYNWMSFITSTTSLFFFISSLMSRYTEQDFLLMVPLNLTLNFIILYCSVGSMLAAFGSAAYALGGAQDEKNGAQDAKNFYPLLAVTSIPILAFMRLQSPLLARLPVFISKYRKLRVHSGYV